LEFQPKSSFTIISNGRVVKISIDEITHVSCYGNETVIYTIDKSYRTHHYFPEIMNDLPLGEFFLLNQSHIIAIKYMNGVKGKRIRVRDYFLPVSKDCKAKLIALLKNKLDKEYLFYEPRL
jgi:DNA-binding LytR/AlgR family response regulator